jgi:hypothetical protein
MELIRIITFLTWFISSLWGRVSKDKGLFDLNASNLDESLNAMAKRKGAMIIAFVKGKYIRLNLFTDDCDECLKVLR